MVLFTSTKRCASSRKLKSPKIIYGTRLPDGSSDKLNEKENILSLKEISSRFYFSKVYFNALRRHLLYIDGLRSAATRFDASWNRCTLSKSKILIQKKTKRISLKKS